MGYAFLVLLVVLQYLDGWTTYKVLSKGGRELNPVVRWFINQFGLLNGLVLVKGSLAVALIAATFYGTMPWWVLGVLCVLYVVVVAHNFKELTK